MSFEIALIFAIIGIVVILFAFEIFPMDKIAFCIMGVLVLFGLISPEEAISGFSNSAVITILCLMILAVALEQNGVISWMANGLKKFRTWPIFFMVPLFMFITGSISASIAATFGKSSYLLPYCAWQSPRESYQPIGIGFAN